MGRPFCLPYEDGFIAKKIKQLPVIQKLLVRNSARPKLGEYIFEFFCFQAPVNAQFPGVRGAASGFRELLVGLPGDRYHQKPFRASAFSPIILYRFAYATISLKFRLLPQGLRSEENALISASKIFFDRE